MPGTVEYIADERRQSSLDGYFDQFSAEQLAGIEAVAMDMWEPYANSVRAHLEDADNKIVFDKFHIMELHGQSCRHRAQTGEPCPHGHRRQVPHRLQVPVALLGGESPRPPPGRFDVLRDGDLKTSRAWAIKENLRFFWEYRRRGWAEKHWKSWYFWATHSRLEPVIEVARTFQRHLDGLFSFFDHRITSAGAEGLNSRIQAIRVSARGYRNREHFKTAIYFHLGGLDLYPQTH